MESLESYEGMAEWGKGGLAFSAVLIIGIWAYQFALLKFGRENDE